MQKSKKIVLLGHFGVGKTSLIRRFVENSFTDNYKVTIGVHITKKVVTLPDNTSVSLILWDLEGTDRLQDVRDSYLLGTHGIFFVFDVTRPSTFQDLGRDLEIVQSKAVNVPIKVIGNKVDLVNPDDLKQLLADQNITSDFLTSAKTGETVEEAFRDLAIALCHA